MWVALALSVVVHALWSLWPAPAPSATEAPVLTATLKEMPPPPAAAAPEAKPKPAPVRPRPAPAARRTPTIESHAPSSVAAPPAVDGPANDAQGSAPSAEPVAAPASDAGTAATEAEAAPPSTPPVALPPRVDLVYRAYLGTQGFMLGDATYRFEHDGNRYRISTVGQARGLAALFVHGTGKIESRGLITPAGLKPLEFAIERGSAGRREIAYFNWDGETVSLNDGQTEDLAAPAFDPLTILWQPYFSPPTGANQITFSLATTRKVTRYTLTREGDETLSWAQGKVETERWHRRSDDGKTEAWFWLAPSLHYIPVKMRITQTSRGTLEARLDSIRVDDSYAGFSEDPTGPTPPPPPIAQPRSPFNDMTGS